MIYLGFLLIFLNACGQDKKPKTMQKTSFYNIEVTDINGQSFDLGQLKGKKVMVVNTASKCGFTPQYKGLQALYKEYKDRGFVIIGFPANNFMWQEPGTNEEIAKFCSLNYQVTFPMMAKIDVKGKNIHPLYQFLTQKALNGVMDSKVKWNFQKYLINESGQLEKVIKHSTKPNDSEIIDWLNKA